MPNWCANSVSISHQDPAKIELLAEAMEKGKFLDFVIPVPQELKDTVAGSYSNDESQALLEAQNKHNREKFGYSNWYDFCVARWHTKWDVDCQGTVEIDHDSAHTVRANFDSAWSPPTGVYAELVEQGYQVVAYYYEPGMCFVGKWDNGTDECYEYDGKKSHNVRDMIGDELDDYFGISEQMAEYEDDNEELTTWYVDGAREKGLIK